MIRLLLLKLARKAGLPLALTYDGRGNPRWHWMPR